MITGGGEADGRTGDGGRHGGAAQTTGKPHRDLGIIGLRYVGLPLAIACRSAGFPVIGFDIDPAKVANLNRGISPIKHISSDRVSPDIPDEAPNR
jgi:UDP-N-acetyl-D-mannosaminuronate dehydrogenase